jgi:hypothetical protein
LSFLNVFVSCYGIKNFSDVKAAAVNRESDQKKSSAEEGGKGRPVASQHIG